MSLDAIRKSILSEAQSKASAADSEASKEAQRITKEAEEQAKLTVKNAEMDARKEAERMNKEAQAGAEMEANSMLLEARGAAVERSLKKVMGEAESEISRNYMKKILEAGVKQFKDVSEGNFRVKTSKKNMALLKDGRYDVEYADIDGFMLYSDSGKVALNATVGSIVGGQMDNARRLISDELFGGSKMKMSKPKSAPKKKSKAPAAKKGKKRK